LIHLIGARQVEFTLSESLHFATSSGHPTEADPFT